MKRLAAIIIASVLATPVYAHDYTLGDLVIQHPWAKPSPKGADVGAAFMVIDNKGKAADRLVSATAANAGHVEIHEMAMDNGVMIMRELRKGLDIPAGGSVELKSGSYHLMLMDLKQPITPSAPIKGTLTFEHAGKLDVEFATEAAGNGGHAH